jgi:hypothetical protein
MSLVTRTAIRFAQILALTLLLAGVVGGTTVARAAEIEIDCAEAAPWLAETIERSEELAAHGKKVDEASYSGDLNRAYGLWIEAIDLLVAAAEDQTESDPPAGLEEVNETLAEAYADAAQSLVDYIAAGQSYDQRGMTEPQEEYLGAANAAKSAMDVVTQLDEACEEAGGNQGGDNRGSDRDRGEDPDPAPVGYLAVVATGEIVDERGDPLDEAMMLVFEEGASCDEIDFEAFFEGDTDQFLVGAVTDRSGEFEVEIEVEIGGEYAVLFTATGYQGICLDGVVFAEDEDAAEVAFETVELQEV